MRGTTLSAKSRAVSTVAVLLESHLGAVGFNCHDCVGHTITIVVVVRSVADGEKT